MWKICRHLVVKEVFKLTLYTTPFSFCSLKKQKWRKSSVQIEKRSSIGNLFCLLSAFIRVNATLCVLTYKTTTFWILMNFNRLSFYQTTEGKSKIKMHRIFNNWIGLLKNNKIISSYSVFLQSTLKLLHIQTLITAADMEGASLNTRSKLGFSVLPNALRPGENRTSGLHNNLFTPEPWPLEEY